MKKLSLTLIAALSIGALILSAQGRKSPHETVKGVIADSEAAIEITYGRPYAKGRKIMGGLVPFGEVWRTGADEATTFETSADVKIGDLDVPAGKYGMFTVPEADGWTLVINKTADQWGAFSYDEGMDLGRTKMEVSKLGSAVEQFTIALEDDQLVMSWEMTQASVGISAK